MKWFSGKKEEKEGGGNVCDDCSCLLKERKRKGNGPHCLLNSIDGAVCRFEGLLVPAVVAFEVLHKTHSVGTH